MGPVRSFAHRALFRVRLRARLAVETGTTVAGLALLWAGVHTMVDVIGAVIGVAGGALLAHDLYRRFRGRFDFRLSENQDFPEAVASAKLTTGFERATFGGATYITSDDVNAALNDASNAVRLLSARYEVPEMIRDHQMRLLKLKLPDYNDSKVGLRTDLTAAMLSRGEPVDVQRTDYFSSVITNDRAAWQIEHCGDERRKRQWSLSFAMADLVVEQGRLIDLCDSSLSNHVGLTALLITSDHNIVLQQQGEQAVDPRSFNLGSSGSLDLGDIYDRARGASREAVLRSLQDAVRYGMEREAHEETSAAVGPGKSTTVLTGYARYLHRGGKPEFFGIVRTASRLDELKATRRELKFVHLIRGLRFEPSAACLTMALNELLSRCEAEPKSHSPSMAVCLRLAHAHVSRFGLDLSVPSPV